MRMPMQPTPTRVVVAMMVRPSIGASTRPICTVRVTMTATTTTTRKLVMLVEFDDSCTTPGFFAQLPTRHSLKQL